MTEAADEPMSYEDAATSPDRIRECARLACEPARTELRRIADEIEREGKRVMDDQRGEA